MAISRDSIKRPTLPKEAVLVAPLGGEVIVRGLLLSERLAVLKAATREPDEEGKDSAGSALDFEHVCQVLQMCVLADDGEPVFATAREWEEFGGQYLVEAVDLFKRIQALSGLDGEALKKS